MTTNIESNGQTSILIKLREIMLITSTLITMAGMSGIFIKIGQYQANFENECNKVEHLEVKVIENYKENKVDHVVFDKDITDINLRLVKYTGNNYEYKIKED